MSHEIPQTERLRLRAYTTADEAELFDVFADPYARRFYPEMVHRARVRAWIEWNLRNYDEFGFGLWAMQLKADGQFVGDCGLTYQDVDGRRELEIGYHVIERERGKGYATEAARACLEFGFTHTSCESICSIVRPSNTASCAVAARVHTTRGEFMKGGQPALLFYTTRHEWEALGMQRSGATGRSHALSRLRSGDSHSKVGRGSVPPGMDPP
jgi:RimJ/RimL family protein N-acetyltransferase